MLPDETGELLPVREFAKRARLNPETVRKLIYRGELFGVRRTASNQWRIPESALEAYLSGQRPLPADHGRDYLERLRRRWEKIAGTSWPGDRPSRGRPAAKKPRSATYFTPGQRTAAAIVGAPGSIRALAREAKLSHVTLLNVMKTFQASPEVSRLVAHALLRWGARCKESAENILEAMRLGKK